MVLIVYQRRRYEDIDTARLDEDVLTCSCHCCPSIGRVVSSKHNPPQGRSKAADASISTHQRVHPTKSLASQNPDPEKHARLKRRAPKEMPTLNESSSNQTASSTLEPIQASPTMPPRDLTLIVAATSKMGIGRNGTLPWTGLKKEMAYFARVTKRVPETGVRVSPFRKMDSALIMCRA